jgi:hypothetical protein
MAPGPRGRPASGPQATTGAIAASAARACGAYDKATATAAIAAILGPMSPPHRLFGALSPLRLLFAPGGPPAIAIELIWAVDYQGALQLSAGPGHEV